MPGLENLQGLHWFQRLLELPAGVIGKLYLLILKPLIPLLQPNYFQLNPVGLGRYILEISK